MMKSLLIRGEECPCCINEKVTDAADYIKNAYRVLLTRGLKKCRILIKEGCGDTLLDNMTAWENRES